MERLDEELAAARQLIPVFQEQLHRSQQVLTEGGKLQRS
jgi:hypothetical protein